MKTTIVVKGVWGSLGAPGDSEEPGGAWGYAWGSVEELEGAGVGWPTLGKLEELGGAWEDFRNTEAVLASLSLQKLGAWGARGAYGILEELGAASEILEVSKGFAFLVGNCARVRSFG